MTKLSDMFTESTDQGTQDTDTKEGDLLFIGEGKKYANEEEADKAIAFKEDHIRKIEEENATLREANQKAATIDEVLKSIRENNQVKDEGHQTDAGNHQENVDIDALVASAVESRITASEHSRTAASNAKLVVDTLSEQYGSKAKELYIAKGQELGIDLDQLSELSPKAVLEYFKQAAVPASGSGYADGTYNTINLTSNLQNQEGTFEHWNKRMQSGEITREVAFKGQHESLKAMGPAKFYGQ